MQMRMRKFILTGIIATAITVPVANRVLHAQQVVKCYFKDLSRIRERIPPLHRQGGAV